VAVGARAQASQQRLGSQQRQYRQRRQQQCVTASATASLGSIENTTLAVARSATASTAMAPVLLANASATDAVRLYTIREGSNPDAWPERRCSASRPAIP
jgi:hypothetical protein